MTDDIDRLRLARAESVGPVTYRRLLTRYGDAAAAIEALPELAAAGGRRTALAVPSRDESARELDQVAEAGARFLFLDTPDYPEFLSHIADPPPALCVMGDIAHLALPGIGMVGSRNASSNGRRIAETLAGDLAGRGYAIVSGLARGIDSAAHLGALANGVTIACVAGGLDVPYPPENAALMERIARDGVVASEMPLGTTPQARHFPRRNRIIAGLSLGLVVVEAAMRSGSLITARLALEFGRELFAVPGSPLDARCQGANNLLRQGAHLTETAADVLANLTDNPNREGLSRDPLFRRGALPGFMSEPPPEEVSLSRADRAGILGLLGPSPTNVDDLIRRCQFSAPAIMAALLELEVAGRVETLPGNLVVLLDPRRMQQSGAEPAPSR